MTIQTKISKPSLAKALASRTRAAKAAREGEVEITAAAHGRNDPAPAIVMEDRAVAELKLPKRRSRKRDAAHIAEVTASIGRFGFTDPLLITSDGTVVDGLTRLEAAQALGIDRVPCVLVDHLSASEITALGISLNRLAEKGGWDFDELKIDLLDLATLDMDLTITGFSASEIDIITTLDDESDAQAKPAPPERAIDADGPAIAKHGDVWLLGPHRLLVGDSREPDSFTRLMAGQRAAAMFTDPPYNIPIAGFVSPDGKHEDFAMGVGEMSDDQFQAFLGDIFDNASNVMSPGAAAYMCIDWRNAHLMVLAGKAAGFAHINTVVWHKGVGGMGSLYRSTHELIGVFANGEKLAVNNVELGKHGRNRENVWVYPGANRKGSSANAMLHAHPTPKPVELVRDALLDVTKRGDIVIDPFLGSGTTIMAAEACGRIAYGIEYEPKYADVIIRRWQAGGGSAVREDAGNALAVEDEIRAICAKPAP